MSLQTFDTPHSCFHETLGCYSTSVVVIHHIQKGVGPGYVLQGTNILEADALEVEGQG